MQVVVYPLLRESLRILERELVLLLVSDCPLKHKKFVVVLRLSDVVMECFPESVLKGLAYGMEV